MTYRLGNFMTSFIQSALLFALLLGSAFPAAAYMGPGAGLTAFGCLVALLAGIWYTCKGFIWLPLKRLLKGKSTQPTEQSTADSEEKQANKPS
jgi:hypothetical protein